MILFFSLLFPLHWLSVSNVKTFSPSFFHQLPVSKYFLFTFFIDYLYQCSSPCLPWRLEPTPELAHLYSDQCQGFARTISTRLYYGCLYSLLICVCDHVQGGYYFKYQQYIIINIGVLWPIWAILMRIHALFGVPLKA